MAAVSFGSFVEGPLRPMDASEGPLEQQFVLEWPSSHLQLH